MNGELLKIAEELARQLGWCLPLIYNRARESGDIMGLIMNSQDAIHELEEFKIRKGLL